jgi:hypothetical protein
MIENAPKVNDSFPTSPADLGIDPHRADLKEAQDQGERRCKFFLVERFVYEAASDTYRCPAGQVINRGKSGARKTPINIWLEPALVRAVPCVRSAPRLKEADGFSVSIVRRTFNRQELEARAGQPAGIVGGEST